MRPLGWKRCKFSNQSRRLSLRIGSHQTNGGKGQTFGQLGAADFVWAWDYVCLNRATQSHQIFTIGRNGHFTFVECRFYQRLKDIFENDEEVSNFTCIFGDLPPPPTTITWSGAICLNFSKMGSTIFLYGVNISIRPRLIVVWKS